MMKFILVIIDRCSIGLHLFLWLALNGQQYKWVELNWKYNIYWRAWMMYFTVSEL